MLHRRLHVRLLSSVAAAGLILTSAGCASSAGKTGPIPEALTGTWTCTIDAEQGKHVGSVGDADDTALWYYGGDRYTVTIATKTWKLEGKQNGKDVTAEGKWGRQQLLWAPKSDAIDYEFTSRDEHEGTSVTLGPELTDEPTEVTEDSYGDSPDFLTYDAKVTVSATRIHAQVDGSVYAEKHGVTCSR
ncbi:hypothetical protein [Curtobacterium sp. 20TX0008]|uniref:hypothetical protein n=1 Tax=Curtobacterium sp. 20TX0008 TaxID=3022018 RepID=UPI00232F8994|nr:hypothetical protein [Curtobacterium sp. 20TX0008]MDB6425951.1 hypothetical protein [Curtobacterium sp. 20TX0008]